MPRHHTEGWWWPDGDVEGRRAIFGTLIDLKHATDRIHGNKTCVQAGGNCGVWAAQLAAVFDEVWTVEPDFENYLCLVQNVPVNVRTFWAALGADHASVGIHRYPANTGAHFVEGPGRVPIITIDELALTSCDLIVLDIEGMEPQALQGARQTIEKFRPVLMVEDKGLSERYGVPAGWSKSFSGYSVAMAVHRDLVLVPN